MKPEPLLDDPGLREGRVRAAIAAGADELFRRQQADGAFGDDPPASTLGTAGAITALHAADPAGSAALIAAGARWLREVQHDDGGWGGVVGAGSEAVATSVAVAALQIVAPDGSVAAIERGRAGLAALGGVAAVTDLAVAHLCAQFQVLAGFAPAASLRRLPLEVVLAGPVRRRRISFRTAPFLGLALMQAAIDPPGRVRRFTNRLAVPTALRLLDAVHQHEQRTGAFSEDPWPAALVCLGLARAGRAPGIVTAIVGFLRRSVRPDGAWDAVSNLDLTRSAFAATGLLAAGYGLDQRLDRTRDLFHRTQQRDAFTVLACPPGGWSFSGAHGWPVTLESAEILAALAGFPDRERDPVLRSGLDWLVDRQDKRGSWSLWVRNTKLANDGPCPAITSQCVVALLEAGHRPDDDAVRSALDWLQTQQATDGTFENLWYRDHTSGTAMVLTALATAGRGGGPVAERARRWLLDTQLADGSWGDGAGSTGSPGTVEETAWTLSALLAAGVAPGSQSIRRGIDWLVDAQRPGGDWPASRVCAYIRHHMHYPNGAITRGSAIRALGAYRSAVDGGPA
ncbi:prenyltransferase/squalene oxidase repeat-containing protein [Pseudonocardia sp. TRM90224]|uniref:prenyltransferase/squalene oxidase repeat-containing protein n=1 Tax=Pseudonocardia sp. TRM90224 TaxID=2812678 RepID=UPI001E3E2FD3|nr:prenyltransferase/squalene oxidase repeat-containing protein [Pseudonocardia sp. TRM90224]